MIPTTPTLDKIKAVDEAALTISAFLEWGREHGLFMCRHNHAESTDALLRLYFAIDAKEEEKERQAVLAYIQSQKYWSAI